ncbi:MAG: ROK family protein [Spirochaetia bacterium]
MSRIDQKNEGARLVLDLGGTCVRTAFVHSSGAIDRHTRKSDKIAKAITTREGLRDLIVEEIITWGLQQRMHVLSLAGPISADNRVIRKCTNVLRDEFDIPISMMVEQEVRRRTGNVITFFVIKDAVAEMGAGGAASDRDEVIALILGTGTGGAPCKRDSNGLIDFPNALADLGHHQLDPGNTEPCNCGSRGCVELSTSGTGVVRIFNRRSQDTDTYAESALYLVRGRAPGSIGAEDIAWAAACGDRFTLALLREAALVLALLLKNVFTSHPEMTVVLVGGFALGVGVPLLTSAREALIEIGLPFIRKSELTDYVESRLLLGRIPGDDTNLIGARLFLSQAERND